MRPVNYSYGMEQASKTQQAMRVAATRVLMYMYMTLEFYSVSTSQ